MCKYCEGNVDERPNLLTVDCEFGCGDTEVYICGNGNLTSGDDAAKINYCPMCGRSLTDGR